MTDPFRRQVNRRTAWLVIFLGLWSGTLVFRLVQLQVLRHERYRNEVIEQSRNIKPIKARRGTIYDRGGSILARSLPAQSVFLTPAADESPADQLPKLEALKDILGLTTADLAAIRRRIEKNERFIYLKRQVPAEVAERAKVLGLAGVASHAEAKRVYPQGRLAAHVLGGVDVDDRGQAGVEFAFNGVLQGRSGEALILRDARRRKYRLEPLQESEPGKDIVLTLDETIQYIAEREIRDAVLKSRAEWGSVIVCRPSTGEVLALANFPDYDPNHYPPRVPGTGSNRAIQHNFEPGSTFKIVTAAAALENEAVGRAETFDCREGSLDIPGRDIGDHKPFGILTFSEVFVHSSNIGAIRIVRRIGERPMRHMIQALGFGRKTGIDLPGEERGIYRPLAAWTPRTLPSVAIGYEISVTSLQLLQALNVIANRGLSVPPRIVRRISGGAEGTLSPGTSPTRVLSPRTAEALTAILERSVEEGTGLGAKVPGFRVAGKTGTAQKYDAQLQKYSTQKHVASFAGFLPAEEPALSMVVVIDEPQGAYYGGQVAAPLFSAIGGQAIRYLKVPPRLPTPRGVIAARLTPGGVE